MDTFTLVVLGPVQTNIIRAQEVELQENGNKYQRIEGELTFIKNGGTNKYVIACAIFASLNSVLLGYG